MVQPTTLKKKHSLVGKSLLPLFARFNGSPDEPRELARMGKDQPLENLDSDGIATAFKKLTGENIGDVLAALGKQSGAGVALLHHAIVLANEIGQPVGQPLRDPPITPPGVSDDVSEPPRKVQRIACQATVADPVQKAKAKGMDILGYEIQDWEFQIPFDPQRAVASKHLSPLWTTLDGREPRLSTHQCPDFESVINDGVCFDLNELPLRNPDHFVAGQVHQNLDQWREVIGHVSDTCPVSSQVLSWLTDGVNVDDFFRPFKGNFKGESFDSDTPPSRYYPNSNSCQQFGEFIASELQQRVKTGAMELVGRVGECQLPSIIMPLTVEPTKPRLCIDNRYLNLWIKDSPFQLETLKHVYRLVDENARMVSTDEKSGYDHVLLSPSSSSYFGVQFGGWVFRCRSLPFGWKSSAYIYQMVGMFATTYLRTFGIRNAQYIDDRLAVEAVFSTSNVKHLPIEVIAYALLQLLTRLGYTFAIHKCKLDFGTYLKYLGFMVDSARLAYILPDYKKVSFGALRDYILSCQQINIKTLQRFSGKCVSMLLAVPAAALYTREVNAAISMGLKNSRDVQVSGKLRAEIEHWRFLDSWGGCLKWRRESHKQIVLATDASLFKYGAVVTEGEHAGLSFSDFWDKDDKRPIILKEADALLKSLQSMQPDLVGKRVDILTDNKPLIFAWKNQGSKSSPLNDLLKLIFQFVFQNSIDLRLFYVPSKLNPADAPSRSLSSDDITLADEVWTIVQKAFGPHSVDLMALDSNAMLDNNRLSLRHFTPSPSPFSSGINVFAQNVAKEGNPYVFPPDNLVLSLLSFLAQQTVSALTMIVLLTPEASIALPILRAYSISKICLGQKGQKRVIKIPSKLGYKLDGDGLKYPLIAYRLSFKKGN
ncbi:uncharacterized protein LOC135496488 [Lineus longissimus]|uniref:uncharacterized protein LOC135496488 n=1 Tax=Lineus longissimus TaxID=88925 RepID=UPI00315D1211